MAKRKKLTRTRAEAVDGFVETLIDFCPDINEQEMRDFADVYKNGEEMLCKPWIGLVKKPKPVLALKNSVPNEKKKSFWGRIFGIE